VDERGRGANKDAVAVPRLIVRPSDLSWQDGTRFILAFSPARNFTPGFRQKEKKERKKSERFAGGPVELEKFTHVVLSTKRLSFICFPRLSWTKATSPSK
jgi:hypothetical protein